MIETPIFIHSLFRSGSTYVYTAFERSKKPSYYCFQEPLNESVLLHRDNPEGLKFFKGSGALPRSLRHPELKRGYFQSMIDTHAAWKDLFREDLIYQQAFDRENVEGVSKFLEALINASPRRPVIQEIRLSWRASAVREAVGGIHIHLWRNPRDQWWSYKTTHYFDAVSRLIAHATSCPDFLTRLIDDLGLALPEHGDIPAKLDYAKLTPASAHDSYRLFYALWLLAALELASASDFDINIDSLSSSESYRKGILDTMEEHGISGLDFSDCQITQSEFGSDDMAFFAPLEIEIEDRLRASCSTPDKIDELIARRKKFQPKHRSRSGRSKILAMDAQRARMIAIDKEDFGPAQRAYVRSEDGSNNRLQLVMDRNRDSLLDLIQETGESQTKALNDELWAKAEERYAVENQQLKAEIGRLHQAADDLRNAWTAEQKHGVSQLARLDKQASQLKSRYDAEVKSRRDTEIALTKASGSLENSLENQRAMDVDLAKLAEKFEAGQSVNNQLKDALEAQQKQLIDAEKARTSEKALILDVHKKELDKLQAVSTKSIIKLEKKNTKISANLLTEKTLTKKRERANAKQLAQLNTQLNLLNDTQRDAKARELTDANLAASLNVQIQQLSSANIELEQSRDHAEARVLSGQRERHLLTTELENHKRIIEQIKASSSWAVTAPMRWVVGAMPRKLGGWLKGGLRSMLTLGLRVTRTIPFLKPFFWLLLRPFPRMRMKTEHFASVRPSLVVPGRLGFGGGHGEGISIPAPGVALSDSTRRALHHFVNVSRRDVPEQARSSKARPA